MMTQMQKLDKKAKAVHTNGIVAIIAIVLIVVLAVFVQRPSGAGGGDKIYGDGTNLAGQGAGSRTTAKGSTSTTPFGAMVAEAAARPSRNAVGNAIIAAAIDGSEMKGRSVTVQDRRPVIEYDWRPPGQWTFTSSKDVAFVDDEDQTFLAAETLSLGESIKNLPNIYPEINVRTITSNGNEYLIAGYGNYEITFEGKPILSYCVDSDREATEAAGGFYGLPGQYLQPGIAYGVSGHSLPDKCWINPSTGASIVLVEAFCGNGAAEPSYANNYRCDQIARPDGTRMECISAGPSAKCA